MDEYQNSDNPGYVSSDNAILENTSVSNDNSTISDDSDGSGGSLLERILFGTLIAATGIGLASVGIGWYAITPQDAYQILLSK